MNLYFTAKWCPPCKQMKPIVSKIAGDLNINIVDVDENKNLANTYGIKSIPTFVNASGDRLKGLQSEESLRKFFLQK